MNGDYFISKEIDRFADRIEQTDGCWLWTGHVMSNGYGQARWNGHVTTAHRAVYEATFGPIPDRLHLDHLCGNRACVNPAHLDAVTQGENNRRAAAHRPDHCPAGHPYDETNTQRDRFGGRKCAACNRAWSKAWRDRRGDSHQ